MSMDQKRHWKCDRCGRTELSNPSSWPSGWARIVMSTPPTANPMEAHDSVDLHLCDECKEQAQYFLADEVSFTSGGK